MNSGLRNIFYQGQGNKYTDDLPLRYRAALLKRHQLLADHEFNPTMQREYEDQYKLNQLPFLQRLFLEQQILRNRNNNINIPRNQNRFMM